MSTACQSSVGYRGYARLCGLVLPYLRADLTERIEIIPSASIHGGGVGASQSPIFRSQHNFSIGKKITDGSLTVEVFGGTGNYASAFTELLKRAIPTSSSDADVCGGFDTVCPLIFSPGGGTELVLPSSDAAQAVALITNFEMRGNPGGNVECTARVISSGNDFNTTGANQPSVSDLAFETAGFTDDSNPVPFYASSFTVTGSGETGLTDRIMDWGITVNNNCTPIYTFNGENFPQNIALGMMEVTGTFSYYSSDGAFVERLTHGATLSISFGSHTLHVPFMAFGPSPIPSPGPNAPTVRNVEFRGFATSAAPAIYFS